jgi:hypothetical protein
MTVQCENLKAKAVRADLRLRHRASLEEIAHFELASGIRLPRTTPISSHMWGMVEQSLAGFFPCKSGTLAFGLPPNLNQISASHA